MMCIWKCVLVALIVAVMFSEANLAVGRSSLRPSGKRSIALGRFSLRPGKRSVESAVQSLERMLQEKTEWECSTEQLGMMNNLMERAASLLEEYTSFLNACSLLSDIGSQL
ncbi:hypothetical protein Tcan_05639 [Toxocara canis]|uniref:Uncharacterized protein n=2 Tax=Toxocara canis TaxID=6265 RepID=A0A0B2VSM0_TOXCA|nr:hypothetical protein Tcan_05639 [Toxocara canis]VDM50045.1 unnamed protein product [Toxocara canis]